MNVQFGQVPATFTRQQRQIVRVFIELRPTHPAVGSSMYRQIAQRLDYRLDKNRSHEFIRRVVRSYLAMLSDARLNGRVTASA